MLTIASHIVLGLAGALYFIAISPFPKEGGPQFGEEFDYIKKFWLAIGMVSRACSLKAPKLPFIYVEIMSD